MMKTRLQLTFSARPNDKKKKKVKNGGKGKEKTLQRSEFVDFPLESFAFADRRLHSIAEKREKNGIVGKAKKSC